MSFDAYALGPDGETLGSLPLGGQSTVIEHWGQLASSAGLPWLGRLDGQEVIVPNDALGALRTELGRIRMLWAEDERVLGGTISSNLGSAEPLIAIINQRADSLDGLIALAQQSGGSIYIG